jgi:hypothetical protein
MHSVELGEKMVKMATTLTSRLSLGLYPDFLIGPDV